MPLNTELELRRKDAEIAVLRLLLRDCRDKLICYYNETGGKYPGGPIYNDLMDSLNRELDDHH